MNNLKVFTFNPFQENTYLVWNKSRQCIIIDPGCSSVHEETELVRFVEQNNLTPIALLNTHCHIDHVLGNYFIGKKYTLTPTFHKLDIIVFQRAGDIAKNYGLDYNPSPDPVEFLEENEIIVYEDLKLKVLLTPGHSPGHIVFYNEQEQYVIGGDVLFKRSIGRTDLPLGNHEQLLKSIREKLYVLPEETIIFPGHGEFTTIGEEKRYNPFTN
jgi:hydroxyacylglutathione hydrolase